MAQIGIIQYKSSFKGGAESVCMHIISALAEEHELTFFTPVSNEINLDEISEFYNLSFDNSVTVECFKTQQLVNNISNIVNRIDLGSVHQKASIAIEAIKQAFYLRGIKRISSNYDLLIWASRGPDIGFTHQHERYLTSEDYKQNKGLEILPPETKSLRYVHCPYYIERPLEFDNHLWIQSVISKVCELVVGTTPPHDQSDRYLSNSNWTSEMLELHNVSPDVVYPPVEISKFRTQKRPWSERENGFVCIGRLARDKNVLQNIEIIDQLRQRGYDVHLHVIGIRTNQKYFEKIARRTKERDYVYLEEEISKNRLIELICTHKFGIHGKEYERFGIAVAEMVAGGVVPFIPDSGGQKEIVQSDSRLVYHSKDEAVTKIENVLDNPELQSEIRPQLMDGVEKFDKERFKTKIKELVNASL